MIDFKVVVLPAPLRPIRQTISPLATSMLTSCSAWLAPYHAFSLLIPSIRSMLPLAEIDPLHGLVLPNLLRRPFGQQFTVVKNQDAIADPKHELHLVLDQDDRSLARELDDQGHHGASFLWAHS